MSLNKVFFCCCEIAIASSRLRLPWSSKLRPPFIHAIPAQQGQPFIPSQSQHYGQNVYSTDMPVGQNQTHQFTQTMQQFPAAPHPHGYPMPAPNAFPSAYVQPNRPITPGSMQPQQSNPQFNGSMTSSGGPGPYNFVPASHGQAPDNVNSAPWPTSQIQGPYGEQTWLPGGQNVAASQQTVFSPAVAASVAPVSSAPTASPQSSSDWQEHTATDGRRYYYNRKTKQSSWEKPSELMTPIERADASTDWKEFSTPDGKKYYYNKVTKQSKWTIPEELQLAREKAEKEAIHDPQLHAANTDLAVSVGTPKAVGTPNSVIKSEAMSSPIPVSPASTSEPAVSAISVSPVVPTATAEVPVLGQSSSTTAIASPSSMSAVSVNNGVHNVPTVVKIAPTTSNDNGPSQSGVLAVNEATARDIQEGNKGMAVAGKVNVTPVEEKPNESEALQYPTKQEAKTAFKALLESAKVESDWTWDQAMRVIVNDKRYGALRTLGERKQAFNEYLGQRKKIEAEERRMRQKKAREEFTKMLEECQELASSTRWRDAIAMFENDERFKAVERVRDREDLFENYMVELQKKEKAMAQEKHKQDLADFRKFLESCDFIKVTSQWRRVQDRLEDDERCLRLEKVDRLLVFQDYIRDLEAEEEEQKKLQKEQMRRAERKNRDAFRKLMDEHVASGTLTAKTQWREYCMKVKESLPYMAVASNTSGSTPKDLFEDVLEELQDKYHEDKTRIKELTKSGKLIITSTWTFEDFKEATKEDLGAPPISDINLKLAFEELLDRIKEKEEKEAKKRQHLADDFTRVLRTKEIVVTCSWEECKLLVEDSQEYRAISDEDTKKQIFEEYIANLEEKVKEKELKREMDKAKKEKEREEKDKRKEKERKEKEREREKDKDTDGHKKDDTDSENHVDSGHKEDKKRDKDRDRKHRKRRQGSADDVSSDREETKKSRRHGSDRKKSRRHNHSDSDSDSKHKRHKRDKESSRRHGGHDELEDGELGDEMET
uniref:Pre-mRNA-processing protein 40A n=1 Tax=Kalanchoe fedtschenkoi TaxID=63787 RepID=A0A7N0SXF7_KALFE